MVLKLKDGTEAEIGMIISDADGVYVIKGIDEARRLFEVQEMMLAPVGECWLRPFGEIHNCKVVKW